jgi:transcriptional regulator with XRE-family HTH domain
MLSHPTSMTIALVRTHLSPPDAYDRGMEQFAVLVREGRERLGLDQAEFGRLVSVGQQAVSRWERGGGRARRAMVVAVADVLGLPVDELLTAAGYVGAVADSPLEVSPSVRPRVRTLPFHELSPERFEDVCVEVLGRLHPGGHVSRFGGPGERQYGIDVLLDGALGATAQCKRHKHFGPKDVRTAVQAVVNLATRNYLFLSRSTATAAARAEMAKHPTWELWDGEDLSRYIRTQMSPEEAIRVVDAYFPNHREPFLGVAQPGPWFAVAEFYAATSGDHVFTHDWNLVGRGDQLALLKSALSGGEHPVTVVFGRGGIGKSRLLRSVAEAFDAQSWVVRMLPVGSEANPAAFELLPAHGHVLLIVDDAHERSDVGQIVLRIRARNQDARILFACRPYGEPNLNRELRGAGLFLWSLPTVTLGDLAQEDATSLAREALGPVSGALADRLATLTRDCPLATTVGGHLIRTGALHPRELEQDDRVRDQILRGFKEALLAESAHGDREQRSAVINALSVLQPFRSGNAVFQEAIVELVGVRYSRIAPYLRSLEDSGVLIRRGDSFRLVPDLLGDVILAEACFDRRSGVDSGYMSEVLASVTGDALAHAFVNVSRVDWQVGHRLIEADEPFWRAIQQDLERMEIDTHLQILKLLGRVAPFQPGKTIDALHRILDHPIGVSSTDTEAPSIFRLTWRHVLEEIPPILRTVAYEAESLPEACAMLWALAQTDRRETNQYPNHPLRVLRELAEYEPGKPMAFNEALLTLAESWADEEPELSPLEAIEALVATEGSSQTYRDHTVYFHPFAVRQDVVRPIRRRAIDLALSEIRSGDPRRGVSGAKFAHLALRYPRGESGRRVEQAELRSWDGDFVETIEAVHEILRSGNLDPVVCVRILEALHSQANYEEGCTRDAAEAAIAALPNSVAFDVALLLHDDWGHLIRERGMPFEDYQRAVDERVELVASRALSELTSNALVLLIEERLSREKAAFERGIAGGIRLLGALVEKRPSLAATIVARLLEDASSPLAALTANLINLIGRWLPDQLMPTVHMLLDQPSSALRTEAAAGLASRGRDDHPLHDGELELLHRFASRPEARVRVAVVEAAGALAVTDKQVAADLLARISFSDSRVVADHLFMHLNWGGDELAWTALNPEQQSNLLAELRRLPDIESYSIEAFLRIRSARDPKAVLDLLRQRIEKAEGTKSSGDFRPIPYHWQEPLAVRAHPDFVILLRELLAWLGRDSSWQRQYFGRELFAAAAGVFDEPVLSLFSEILWSGDEVDVHTVASVLEKAQNNLVFDHVNFVSDALDAAARFGSDALRAMRGGFWASAISGVRWGTPGQPFAEDIRLRDQCAAIAKSLPRGSLTADFYRDLSESGARSVVEEVERDRSDGRAW